MTIKQGKNGVCYSEFYLEKQVYRFAFNGKKGMPLITSKKEAREYESDLRRQLRAGSFVKDSPIQNFARFYTDIFMKYSKEHKSEKAQMFDEYYGAHLMEEFGQKRLSQITPSMVEYFLKRLSRTKTQYGKKLSPVTIRMIYGRLNQLFNLAARERIFFDNPCRLVNKAVLRGFPSWQPRKRYLNKYAADEEERLFQELNGNLSPICRLLLHTGLRPPKEIMRAEKAHINLTDKPKHYRYTKRDGEHLEGRHVIIPPMAFHVVHGKGGVTRTIPLNDTAHGILTVLCGDETTGDFLFLNRDGERQESIKKGFAAACARAGIEDLRPYDLRGTFATRLVERGVHQYVISALMGHAIHEEGFGHESRITPGYAQATWEAMVRALESLEYPASEITVFGRQSGKIQEKSTGNDSAREKVKAG